MHSGFSDRGIVLGSIDYKDGDRIVNLLTEYHGLGRFLARGARKQGSKKGSHLDLFQLIRFQTQRGDSLFTLAQVETEKFFPNVKQDFSKVRQTMIVAEILNNVLAHDVPDKEIFISLENYLIGMEKSNSADEADQLTKKFGLYLLRHLGFPPPPNGSSISNYFEKIIDRKIIASEIR
jgi:DNA repair protein RecO (recombination protein O)